MQDMAVNLWTKAAACFKATSWSIEWRSAVEELCYLLRRCSVSERQYLFEWVAEMAPDTVSKQDLPAYWFFTHPTFAVFEDWLDDEEMNMAYADHLLVLSHLGHFGGRSKTMRKGQKTYRRALRRAKVQKNPKLHQLYSELLWRHFPGATIEQGRLTVWPEDFWEKLEFAKYSATLQALSEYLTKHLRKHYFAWSFHPLSDTKLGVNDSVVKAMRDSGLNLNQVAISYKTIVTTDLGPINWPQSRAPLEVCICGMMRSGRWLLPGLDRRSVGWVHLEDVAIKKAYYAPSEQVRAFFQNHALDPWAVKIRKIKGGRLPVGIKIHPIRDMVDDKLAKALKCMEDLFGSTPFQFSGEAIVMSPVGSVDALCEIFNRAEKVTGIRVFDHPALRLQVCHAGDLDNLQSAVLGACSYLGSDVLRRYRQEDFTPGAMHVGETQKRLVIRDAGMLDTSFNVWMIGASGNPVAARLELMTVPANGRRRRDVLGLSSEHDVRVTNLVATLMAHLRHQGYWHGYGYSFIKEVVELFSIHQLSAILDARWLPFHRDEGTTPEEAVEVFWNAFSDLQEYAFAERERIDRARKRGDQKAARSGILFEMREILDRYDQKLTLEAERLEREGLVK